jgi:phospholipid-binding lipoprotein MlaA
MGEFMLFFRYRKREIALSVLALFFLSLPTVPAAYAATGTKQAGAASSQSDEYGYYGEYLLLLAQADDAGEDFDDDDDLFAEYEEEAQIVADPLEGFNRAVFSVNDFLYSYLLKPVSYVYANLVVEDVRTGISNVFHNIHFPIRFVNCLLQGKMKKMGVETGRFLLNSTFGLGGLFDPADTLDALKKPSPEDFGQTLGHWGVGHGFYLVLPLLGPSSARDAAGFGVDVLLDPLTWLNDEVWGTHYYAAYGVDVVNEVSLTLSIEDKRVQYDGRYDALKRDFGVNPYIGFRNAYIQNRDELVSE